MTTIYFMRHSETKTHFNINNNDPLQIQNEKWVLSTNGEKLAEERSKKKEFKDFNLVVSSNYARSIGTAKYFTNEQVFIDDSFNERKYGVSSFEQLPKNFELLQLKDFNYKIPYGESLNEVKRREDFSLNLLLNHHKGQKILVVGHATALTALFSNWCKIEEDYSLTYKNKKIFDGKWNNLETFKLEFDDNSNLINIENIKV